MLNLDHLAEFLKTQVKAAEVRVAHEETLKKAQDEQIGKTQALEILKFATAQGSAAWKSSSGSLKLELTNQHDCNRNCKDILDKYGFSWDRDCYRAGYCETPYLRK